MNYPVDEGGRDVFALGSVIVKSSHLHGTADGRHEIDYSYANANEVQAIYLASSALGDVRMPEIHFAGQGTGIPPSPTYKRRLSLTLPQVNGHHALGQERLPGVALTVAYPYLSQTQKESFKQKARQILRVLHAIKLPSTHQARNHVVSDPNIPINGRITPLEAQLLFSGAKIDSDVGFVHNNFSTSDIIVGDDWIVGLVGWEVAGFFSWKTAGEVHSRIRTPQSENFVNAGLSEETLRDTMRWNDLYHDGMPESK